MMMMMIASMVVCFFVVNLILVFVGFLEILKLRSSLVTMFMVIVGTMGKRDPNTPGMGCWI